MGIKSSIKKVVKDTDRKFFNGKITQFFKKNIRKDKMVGISLDISGNCNLNCETCCFMEKYGEKGIMSFETFNKLEGLFSKILGVELQCNAEPLLNPNIGEIIKSIKNENRNIQISLVTNGTLLNEKTASILLESGIDKISISVDSCEKELFEKLRGGANFETVINNIRNTVNLKNKINDKCKIGIVTVSSKSNIHQLKDLLDLIKELKVDNWVINGLEAYDEEMEKVTLYGNEINLETENIFKELKSEADKCKIELLLPELKIASYKDCGLDSCLIHWNGDVSPCSGLSYERKIYSFGHDLTRPKVVFGNINDENVFEIWDKKEYKIFRKNLREGRFPGFCENCLLKSKVICPIAE